MPRPKTEAAEYQPITIRLPKELYAAVQERARRETRPVNGQIIVLLRAALEAHEPPKTSADRDP